MVSKAATLEIAVLGLLHDSPLHGYELRKRLNLLLGWTRLLSYGSLYPALYRLEDQGWIKSEWGVSDNNRKAKFYRLTDEGRAAVRRALPGHLELVRHARAIA